MNEPNTTIEPNDKNEKQLKSAKTLAVMAILLAVAAFLSTSTLCYVFGGVAIVFSAVAIKLGGYKKCAVTAIVFAAIAILIQLAFDIFFEKLVHSVFDKYFWQLLG